MYQRLSRQFIDIKHKNRFLYKKYLLKEKKIRFLGSHGLKYPYKNISQTNQTPTRKRQVFYLLRKISFSARF